MRNEVDFHMKLSVSNLAWPSDEANWCLEQLVKKGIYAVELAPLKVFSSWDSITDRKIAKLNEKYEQFGVSVSSFQAITFGTDELALLGDEVKVNNFLRHMEKVAYLLFKLGGENAVFGSPSLRKIPNFDENELKRLFVKIDKIFSKYNVNFVWETVPHYYGCELLNNIQDTDSFFSRLDLKSVWRHFDTGCQYLSSDLYAPDKCAEFIANSKHLHISEVNLDNFSNPAKYNIEFAEKIRRYYRGSWCVLEMGEKGFSRDSFIRSLENFKILFSK